MNKNLSLNEIRQYWQSDEFLFEVFEGEFNRKSAKVSDLLYTLKNIPANYRYTIAAYGSLLNSKDICRTMPTAHNFRSGYIYGYQRIFNMGSIDHGCFLNMKKNSSANTICRFIDIDYDDLPHYILREGLYNIIELDKENCSPYQNNNPILTVIGKKYYINKSTGIEPQLNYLHMCLTGIKELSGMEGVNNFLEETLCYSNDDHDYIPAKEYLYKVDLINYMISKDYSSR